MKKLSYVALFSVLVALFLLAGCATKPMQPEHGPKPYNAQVSKEVMRSFVGSFQAIKGGLEKDDFALVEKTFMDWKAGFQKMLNMQAPKEPNDEWKEIFMKLDKLAGDGAQAASAKDKEKIGMILGEIGGLQKEGHGLFQNY